VENLSEIPVQQPVTTQDQPAQQFRTAPRLESHDPRNLKVSKEISFYLRIHSARLKFTFLLMLSTKYLMGKELSDQEKFLFWNVFADLEEYRNGLFWNGHRIRQWLAVENVVLLMQDTSVTPRLRQANLNWNIQRKLFPSLFAYFGWRLEEKVVLFVRRVNRLLRRPPPPKRFVGVGYRDNGHRRNVALDGSPSWQEVASVHLEDPNKSKRLRGFEVWSLLRKQALKF